MRKLRIAQIAPLIERVPPKKYGGTERVVSALTEELVRRGHDVTLFASRDSKTAAKLEYVYPRGLREANLNGAQKINWSMFHIGKAYKNASDFDIIHDHNSIIGAPLANMCKTPTVITLHGIINEDNKKIFENFRNPNYVSISNDQVRYVNLGKVSTIYNGLSLKHYPLAKKHKNYLLFIGRISMLKGVHYAIDVANMLDLPLIIAAKLDEGDIPYFKEYVEPKLSDKIQWIGEVDEASRNKLLSEAICLLNPITWREPFGLNMIEAMACGCPVIAFNNGAIPEVMREGVTGFIVEDVKEMAAAVKRLNIINREETRNYALNNFNDKRMADGYERLYYKILAEEIEKKSDRFVNTVLNNDAVRRINYLNYKD